MGPTKVFKCLLSDPDTIRAKHGLSDTRNATHGSGNLQKILKIMFIDMLFKIFIQILLCPGLNVWCI